MSEPITIVISGKVYKIEADKPQTLQNIPASHRMQLIGLLETLKSQENRMQQIKGNSATAHPPTFNATSAATAIKQTRADQPLNHTATANNLATQSTPANERLGKGDVDQLMARLILEEKRHAKPGITKATVYKAMGIILLIIVVISFF